MSELRTRLLPHTMKPEEIAGDADTKHRRVVELVRWVNNRQLKQAVPSRRI